jgi:hypothetical protein
MKSILSTLIVMIVMCSSVNAQHEVKSDKYKIAFTTTEKLKQYETEAETVLGYENNNYAVDIEVFKIEEQPASFIASQKRGAVSTAKSLGLEDAALGGKVPHIPNAYYAIAYEVYDGERNPVFVIAALNKKLGIAYEATIYCYSNDLGEGQKIAKSFRLLN